MGGYAYLISGAVDARVWQDVQHPPSPAPSESIWSRITSLGCSGPAHTFPKVTTYPNGDRLIELQADPLPDRLIPDCLHWVQSSLTTPSQASVVVLEYLKEITPPLHLRGDQPPSETSPAFYIQMMFSGCAGMAETSARLSSHWTTLWYRANHDRLTRDYFAPFGFQPEPYDSVQDEPLLFLPLGKLGYVEYVPSEDQPSRSRVELDQSVVVSCPDELDIKRLTEKVGEHMAARRCRCQLCEPGLGDIPFN